MSDVSSPIQIERKPIKKSQNPISSLQTHLRDKIMSESRSGRNIISTVSINNGISDIGERMLSPQINRWRSVKRFTRKRSKYSSI